MTRVRKLTRLPGYQLSVELESGESGILSLGNELSGEIFEPLKDPSKFNQARVDEFGVICWPNGADLAPEFIISSLRRDSQTT